MKELHIAAMCEASRAKLIGEIATIIRSTEMPPEARQAGLTLIGWLARRMPQDPIDSRTTRCSNALPRRRVRLSR